MERKEDKQDVGDSVDNRSQQLFRALDHTPREQQEASCKVVAKVERPPRRLEVQTLVDGRQDHTCQSI